MWETKSHKSSLPYARMGKSASQSELLVLFGETQEGMFGSANRCIAYLGEMDRRTEELVSGVLGRTIPKQQLFGHWSLSHWTVVQRLLITFHRRELSSAS